MDTSKQYIKMCDCPEIQGHWKPSEGDNFSFINEPKIIKDYEIWALEKRELSDIEEWNKIIKTMGNHFVDHFIEARDCFVWLPRQDQIQEMMGLGLYDLLEQLKKFIDKSTWTLNEIGRDGLWGKAEKCVGFTSLEQLWLAFYMHEEHGKIWNDKKWIK